MPRQNQSEMLKALGKLGPHLHSHVTLRDRKYLLGFPWIDRQGIINAEPAEAWLTTRGTTFILHAHNNPTVGPERWMFSNE